MSDADLPNRAPPPAGDLGEALLEVLLARSPADLLVLDEHLRVLRCDAAGTAAGEPSRGTLGYRSPLSTTAP
ncbi:hypothetical protein ACWD01_30005 [Streptomyces sp. NPDC002835]